MLGTDADAGGVDQAHDMFPLHTAGQYLDLLQGSELAR